MKVCFCIKMEKIVKNVLYHLNTLNLEQYGIVS